MTIIYCKSKMATVLILITLMVSGCASIISIFSNEPIKSNPGNVPIGTSINDIELETIIGVNIKKCSSLQMSNIVTVILNGDLLFIGQVESEKEKIIANEIAEKVYGIKKIFNQLEIMPKTTFAVRAADSWITSKVKSMFLVESELPSTNVKVATEAGVVYLMGSLTKENAAIASNIASNVSGVKKVVTIFNYL